MTDTELITRILAGEDRLFGRLVERYAPLVWAVCSSYIVNRSDCEDVAQNVFVQCYLSLDSLKNRTAFKGWLSQLARRRCLDWLRSASRRRSALDRYRDHVLVAGEAGIMTDRHVDDDLRSAILRLVQELPPKTREAMFLCYGEGYPAAEAANLLGISPDALTKRLAYGRELLQQRVGEEIEPALASRKHTETFTKAAMAAVPFGGAPWAAGAAAGTGVSTAALAKIGTLGGIAMVTKKTVVVAGAVLLVLAGLVFTATQRRSGEPARVIPTAPRTLPAPQTAQSAPTAPARTVDAPVEKESSLPPAATPPEEVPPTLPQATERAAESVTVSGVVRDEAGYPFEGADIQLEVVPNLSDLRLLGSFRTRSKADGAFTIADINVFGRGFAYASAPGCLMQRASLKLVPGKNHDNVDFALPKGAFVVAGRVVSESGRPVAGATVGTPHYGYSEEGFQEMTETGGRGGRGDISNIKFVFAITDERGNFEMAVPDEGFCDITVTAAGYAPAYFPKVHTGTDQAVFTLRAGGAIAGKVTDREDNPIKEATVTVVGEAYPGGLDVGVQSFATAPCVVTTDAQGGYVAEGLGEQYVYTVTVPATETSMTESLPEEQGIRRIAKMMDEFNEALDNARAIAAQKKGIRVEAGRATSGVDLVVGQTDSARIHGTVKDRTTGAPACPVVVMAYLAEATSDDASSRSPAEAKWRSECGGTGVTTTDGSYTLLIRNLKETQTYGVSYEFMTEGGSAWEQVDEEVAKVDLGPGDKEEVNFAVDAPVTVPVRYVDVNGAPLEGIKAAIRQAGGGGGCGGSLVSDAEGRVTFHGIPPFLSLEVLAWVEPRGDIATIGVSDPFAGQPGETVPEVVVVCRALGGIEGVLVDADGNPVSSRPIRCIAQRQDGTMVEMRTDTDSSGAFTFLDALSEGIYPRVFVGYETEDGAAIGTVNDVEVAAEQVSNIGAVVLRTLSMEEAQALILGQ